MKKIHTDSAPKAIGPYTQAVITGNLVYCSGQTPLNPQTMKIEAKGIADQPRVVLSNIELILKAAGSNLSKVVKTSVFLKNFADFQEMNKVYEEVFGNHKPARTTVEVSRLPLDALVEIDCVAEIS